MYLRQSGKRILIKKLFQVIEIPKRFIGLGCFYIFINFVIGREYLVQDELFPLLLFPHTVELLYGAAAVPLQGGFFLLKLGLECRLASFELILEPCLFYLRLAQSLLILVDLCIQGGFFPGKLIFSLLFQ